MANLCHFCMRVRGNKENIQSFYDALTQKHKVYMGRGADADICFHNDNLATIKGNCKWSIHSALIGRAIDMRQNPDGYRWHDVNPSGLIFLTLIEACQIYNITAEVFSEETGVGFQEHYFIKSNGEYTDECVDYCEYWLDEFDSKEEAEKEFGETFTDEEWEEEVAYRGGFESWTFADELEDNYSIENNNSPYDDKALEQFISKCFTEEV